ncbi:ATP-binding cassette domain-containing protein [Candidatus Izemoplasma sp. B36]|uniref:ABC transporter ATP-binding protein/permease n=1 Tax=Candidatus Izemoplasma sp. B36 TaxID=3242468 RepID=UPI003555EE0F
MIKVKNVDKYFNKNKRTEIHVLNEINVEFPDKGLIVLKGNSGSGKTTFLNILGGLDKVHAGEINFDDQIIKNYNPKIWNQIRTEKIGYIFQNYYLIPKLSVFENVAIVLRMIGVVDEVLIKERVHYILKQVGIYNFRKRNANQLSGGQQQRVAIARALIKNPKIIIADEPTGNLDSKNTVDVMNIIKKISKQCLVVLVTHEKSIAEFYGDRIIEISDGKIIDDYQVESSEVYQVEETDTYYLKDFKHQEQLGNISFYTNDEHINLNKDIKVRLIYQNGRLVIDIDGVIKKSQLVSEDSNVKIYDSHHEAVDKDTFMETSYQMEDIKVNKNIKNKETLYTFKNNLRNAFIKVIKMTRVKKVMLIGFIISGMITAFAASIIGNRLFDDYHGITELENYVEFNRQALNMGIEEVTSLIDSNDDQFWLNPYTNDKIKVTIPSYSSSIKTYYLEGELDIIDHISEEDIIYGRMPENIYEIVVDKSVYTNSNEPYSRLTEFGIWYAEQLIGEKIILRGVEIEIVGVCDVESQRFFGDRTILTILSYKTTGITSLFISIDYLNEIGKEIEIVDGRMPTPGSKEILIPTTYANDIIPSNGFDSGPYEYHGMLISGSYNKEDYPFDKVFYLAYNQDMEYYVFMQTLGTFSVYTSEPEMLLDKMRNADLVASWPYGNTIIEAKIEQIKLNPILYISVFILIFTGLGMYYMMRSSMLSRIYEISVYRALGVKQSSIMKEFIAELMLITTLSTLLGFLIASILIVSFQEISYLKEIVYMNLSAFLLGLFLIYTINIIFGILSIRRQLQKTPAELLSNYDM